MWGGAGELTMAREICAGFVEQYPHIAVELNIYPWGQYWAKLQTQAASNPARSPVAVCPCTDAAVIVANRGSSSHSCSSLLEASNPS